MSCGRRRSLSKVGLCTRVRGCPPCTTQHFGSRGFGAQAWAPLPPARSMTRPRHAWGTSAWLSPQREVVPKVLFEEVEHDEQQDAGRHRQASAGHHTRKDAVHHHLRARDFVDQPRVGGGQGAEVCSSNTYTPLGHCMQSLRSGQGQQRMPTCGVSIRGATVFLPGSGARVEGMIADRCCCCGCCGRGAWLKPALLLGVGGVLLLLLLLLLLLACWGCCAGAGCFFTCATREFVGVFVCMRTGGVRASAMCMRARVWHHARACMDAQLQHASSGARARIHACVRGTVCKWAPPRLHACMRALRLNLRTLFGFRLAEHATEGLCCGEDPSGMCARGDRRSIAALELV